MWRASTEVANGTLYVVPCYITAPIGDGKQVSKMMKFLERTFKDLKSMNSTEA